MKDAQEQGSLAGRIEVRAILEVSKQRASVLENHPDFPAPLDVLEDGHGRPLPVWEKSAIEEYARRRSTAGGRPAAADVKG